MAANVSPELRKAEKAVERFDQHEDDFMRNAALLFDNAAFNRVVDMSSHHASVHRAYEDMEWAIISFSEAIRDALAEEYQKQNPQLFKRGRMKD